MGHNRSTKRYHHHNKLGHVPVGLFLVKPPWTSTWDAFGFWSYRHALSKPNNWKATQDLFSSAAHFCLIYFFLKKYFAIPPTTHIHFQANYTLRDNQHKDDHSLQSQGKAQSNKQDNFPWSLTFFQLVMNLKTCTAIHLKKTKTIFVSLFFLLFCYPYVLPAALSPTYKLPTKPSSSSWLQNKMKQF